MISTGNTAGRIRIAMRIPEIPAADGITAGTTIGITTTIITTIRSAVKTKANSR